jgi:hypothetical protein
VKIEGDESYLLYEEIRRVADNSPDKSNSTAN